MWTGEDIMGSQGTADGLRRRDVAMWDHMQRFTRSRRIWAPFLVLLAVAGATLPLMGVGQKAHATAGLPPYYQRIHNEIAQELANNKTGARSNGANTGLREAGPTTAAQFEYGQRALPGTVIAPSSLINAQTNADGHTFNGIGVHWKQLGPTTLNNGNYFPEPVSGRILAIAIDPKNSKVIYIGAAQGGVWKTTDGGKHWRALTDLAPSLAINAIVIDQKNPNIIFAGTGEDNLSCDAYHGEGILRSTNGGRTWTVLGRTTFRGSAVGNILLDPRYEGKAEREHLIVGAGYAGTTNSSTESCDNSLPAGQNPVYGVFVSTNGGKSFTKTLDAGSASSFPYTLGVSDMVMSPSNPNVIYAAEQVQGIFESHDAGLTWTNLDASTTSGLPAPFSGFDRVQIAVAPSNAQVLYAVYSNQVFQSQHMQAFKSTDGGATWANLTSVPDVCDGQCWYDMPITVSPTNPNDVYIGGNANYSYIFSLFGFSYGPADCQTAASLANLPSDCNATIARSTDGGQTWQDISLGTLAANGFPAGKYTLHPDDHAIVFDPSHPNVMYTGNDGGLFMTTDGGKTWNDLNAGLGTLQFQGFAVGPTGQIFGGTQDNGTEKYTPQTGTTWTSVDGGDGGLTQIDPTNANIVYHTYAGPSLMVTPDGGTTWDEIDGPFYTDPGSFYSPFALAPSQPSTLYYGTYRIWRTDDRGGLTTPADYGFGHWTSVSPDLTGTNAATNGCGFGCISSVAVSPVNPNVVVVGTGRGLLWQSTNADSATPTWQQINTASTPNRFITQVVFAPGSQNTVYVTYSGFNTNAGSSAPGHVFVSTTIGTATPVFTEMDGQNAHGDGFNGIPDEPTNSVLVDPHHPGVLFVAADYGVYVTTNGGRNWARLDGNLPHSEVYMLQYDSSTNSVIAATHGRGIWSLRLEGLRRDEPGPDTSHKG